MCHRPSAPVGTVTTQSSADGCQTEPNSSQMLNQAMALVLYGGA